MLEQPSVFIGCSSIEFFNLLPFHNKVTEPPVVTYQSLRRTHVSYKTPCHSICHQVLPNQPLSLEAEDFFRNDKYTTDMPLPTYLNHLQAKDFSW